jgi:DNA-binding transcriptional ArsR family regulator
MADRAAKDALYDGFAEVARALASGRQAEIADLLAQGERPVEQIADEIGQSVANTSHHLRAMARAGLVTARRDGTRIFYALASDRVACARCLPTPMWWPTAAAPTACMPTRRCES